MTDQESNVVSFDGKPIVDLRNTDEHLVKTIEGLLEAAKSGEIIGVSCVYDCADNTTNFMCSGVVSRSTIGSLHIMMLHIAGDLKI